MKLKRIRENNNYTQEYIAEYLKISQSNYSRIENGTIKPSVEILIKLSTLYFIPINELITNHNPVTNNTQELEEKIKNLENEIVYLKKIIDKLLNK